MKKACLYEVPKFRVRCISGHKWEMEKEMDYRNTHSLLSLHALDVSNCSFINELYRSHQECHHGGHQGVS